MSLGGAVNEDALKFDEIWQKCSGTFFWFFRGNSAEPMSRLPYAYPATGYVGLSSGGGFSEREAGKRHTH